MNNTERFEELMKCEGTLEEFTEESLGELMNNRSTVIVCNKCIHVYSSEEDVSIEGVYCPSCGSSDLYSPDDTYTI